MSGVFSFALLALVVAIIFTIVTQIEYKQRRITRLEARIRQMAALFVCIPCAIFASIAAYFHISLLFVLLALVLLSIVIGVIAHFVFREKTPSRRQPEQREESAPPRQTFRSRPQPKEAREAYSSNGKLCRF